MFYSKKQIRDAFFMVPLGGVDLRVFKQHLEVIDDDTGEVLQEARQEDLYTLGLPAGQHKGAPIAEAAPQNARFEPIGEVAAAVRVVGNARMQEPTRMTPQQPKGKHKTGANEEYVPRNLEEQRAEATVKSLNRAAERAERASKELRKAKEEKREEERVQLRKERKEKEREDAEAAKEKAEEDARQAALDAEKAAGAKAGAEPKSD